MDVTISNECPEEAALRRSVVAVATFLSIAPAMAGGIDGTYSGSREAISNASACSSMSGVTITIRDNNLLYQHHNRLGQVAATIETGVAADGSFAGNGTYRSAGQGIMSVAVQSLTGKVTGTTLDATTTNSACTFRLTLKKQ
jgi:hypothetical protein